VINFGHFARDTPWFSGEMIAFVSRGDPVIVAMMAL
jgi:hypothetical protein